MRKRLLLTITMSTILLFPFLFHQKIVEREEFARYKPFYEVSALQGGVASFRYNKENIGNISCLGNKIYTFSHKNGSTFLIPIPFDRERDFFCYENKKPIVKVTPKQNDFEKTYERLATRGYSTASYSRKENIKISNDSKNLKNVYSTTAPNLLFTHYFQSPIKSIETVTGNFGDTRINTIDNSETVHKGIDYKGKTGQKVFSINDGDVVLAEELFFCGKTVIIDHGLDIFSIYCHLNDISVSLGGVEKGQLIGSVGSTGRSTGPHLHLAIKINQIFVDPNLFFSKIRKIF